MLIDQIFCVNEKLGQLPSLFVEPMTKYCTTGQVQLTLLRSVVKPGKCWRGKCNLRKLCVCVCMRVNVCVESDGGLKRPSNRCFRLFARINLWYSSSTGNNVMCTTGERVDTD